jgi:glycosyltransferase involved in cell wall biosynthesis
LNTKTQLPVLRIVHVLRAPVGGLFRHVLDLAAEQSRQGHIVGIICDSTTGGAFAKEQLAAIRMVLRLGVKTMAMARNPGWGDLATMQQIGAILSGMKPNVVHGHGAKGGLYARLAKVETTPDTPAPVRIYTPHGGSLHYTRSSLSGFLFLSAERFLMNRGDAIIFESQFGKREFIRKVGQPRCAVEVVHNGLRKADFDLAPRDPDGTDFLFLGELRHLKGLDVLLSALKQLWKSGPHEPTLTVVGDGPDAAELKARAKPFGRVVRFLPPEQAFRAFRRARCVVLPSRAESLPYVVLEGLSSGLPVIATNVGGISEIYGEAAARFLVKPDDSTALAKRLGEFLNDPKPFEGGTIDLRSQLRESFSSEAMTQSILRVYGRVLGQEVALTPDSVSGLNAY